MHTGKTMKPLPLDLKPADILRAVIHLRAQGKHREADLLASHLPPAHPPLPHLGEPPAFSPNEEPDSAPRISGALQASGPPSPSNPHGAGSLPAHTKAYEIFGNPQPAPHSYGCVYLRIPSPVSDRVLRIGQSIPDTELAADGREQEIHVTALHGLTNPDPEPIFNILSHFRPIRLRLTSVSVFAGEEYDVLKIDVESDQLTQLHETLRDLPHYAKFRDFRPHCTIAYLRPGLGSLWAAQFTPFDADCVCETVVFSDASGTRYLYPLGRTITITKAMSSLNATTGGSLVAPPAQGKPVRLKRRKRTLVAVQKALASIGAVNSFSLTSVPELVEEATAAPAFPDIADPVESFFGSPIFKAFDESRVSREKTKHDGKRPGEFAPKNTGGTKTEEGKSNRVKKKGEEDETPEWDGTIEQREVKRDRGGWHEDNVASWDFYDDGGLFPQTIALESGEYTPPGADESIPVYRWVSYQDGDGFQSDYGQWTADESVARSGGKHFARISDQEAPDPEDSDIRNVSHQQWLDRDVIAHYDNERGATRQVRLEEGTFEFAGDTHNCYRWTTRDDEDGEWTLSRRQAIRDGKEYAGDMHHESEEKDADEVWQEMFGEDGPSPLEICGALDGSEYTSKVDDNGNLEVTITHPKIEDCIRTFYRTDDGRVYVHNDLFIVKDKYQKEGIGATVFAAQATACAKAGVAWIECHAAGPPANPTMNGYYTWPRFGYDMSLSEYKPETQAKFKKLFPDAKSVLDIMATPSVELSPDDFAETKAKLDALDRKLKKEPQERTTISGGDWWKVNGTQMLNAKFDLSPGSRSLAILSDYQKELRAKKEKAMKKST